MQALFVFLQHHSTLTFIFLVTFFALMVVEFIRLKRGTLEISPAELTQLINHDEAAVLDIRTTDAFAKGHIINALSIPLSELSTQLTRLKSLKSKSIIIVSANGMESAKAALHLQKEGFTVRILKQGMRAWTDAEMPLIKG